METQTKPAGVASVVKAVEKKLASIIDYFFKASVIRDASAFEERLKTGQEVMPTQEASRESLAKSLAIQRDLLDRLKPGK
jgi:hypothetical protein